MAESTEIQDSRSAKLLVASSRREFMGTLVAGALVGLVVAVLFLLFWHVVFQSVLCKDPSSSECARAADYGFVIAQIVGLLTGVGVLSARRIYRPLLVAVLALLATWSLAADLGQMAWLGTIIVAVILYSALYSLFAWVVRPRSLTLAIVIAAVALVVVRLAFA